ncbi:MAG: mechanosensitive ion channel family protein, partial [Anaeroplasma sp.]
VNMKKNKKKIIRIIEIVLASLVIVMFVAAIITEIVAKNSDFGIWMKENVWDIDATLASLNAQVPTIIHCVIYIVVVYSICQLIRMIFRKQMQKSNRAKTVITLFDGIVKYACAIILIILILKACGVNTTAIFASVGILTLVIGLGCQSLIADVVAGMFIIFENEYNVGEIVTIGDFRGTVIEIGIRATKLLDTAGNIKIINNSDVSNVINMSRELSLASVTCEFPYDVPIEFIENLLKNNFNNFKKKIPAIVEGPYYKGVSNYGDSNVSVMVVAKCKEEDRYQVQRDLLREYRSVFLENGIDLSFQQVVINQPVASGIEVTESQKRQAEKFMKAQTIVSKGIEEQEGQ